MSIYVTAFLLNATWQIPVIAGIAFLLTRTPVGLAAAERHRLWALALALSLLIPLGTLRFQRDSDLPTMGAVSTQSRSHGAEVRSSTWVTASPRTVPVRVSDDWRVALSLLWCAFVAVGLLRLLRGARRIAAMRTRSLACPAPAGMRAVEESCRRWAGVKSAPILWSSSLGAPVSVGWLDPVIILPERFRRERARELWTAILGHELAHVRRRDFGWNVLYELVCVFIGFHPVTHLLKREIDRTRERACDEAVTADLLGRRDYARALIASARLFRAPTLAHSLGVLGTHPLKERIMSLISEERRSHRQGRTSALSLAVTLLVASASVSAFALSVREPDEAANRTEVVPIAAGEDGAVSSARASRDARYRHDGRRDPFLGPRVETHSAIDGPRGFDIDAVTLQGIVKTPRGFTAMVQGPDEKVYFIHAGERFFNGVLVGIDEDSLKFRVQDDSGFSLLNSRDKTIRLHPPAASGGATSPVSDAGSAESP